MISFLDRVRDLGTLLLVFVFVSVISRASVVPGRALNCSNWRLLLYSLSFSHVFFVLMSM